MTITPEVRRPSFQGLMASMVRYGVVFDTEGLGEPTEELSEEDLDDGSETSSEVDETFDDEGAEDAFLATLKPAEGDEPAEGTETPAKPAKAPTASDLADDVLVAVKVGDETHNVSAKDLKALFAQREELTGKTAAITAATEQAAERAAHAKKVVTAQLARAEERFKPYAELDFLVLSKNPDISVQMLTDLRKEAQAAFDEVSYLRQEATATGTAATQATSAVHQEQVRTAIATLTKDFPAEFGEEWSETVYGDLMGFAKTLGLRNADGITDPAAMKLIRMAQLYQKGKATAKAALKPGASQPRKPLRSGSTATSGPSTDIDQVLSRLRRSGSADDAEAAFAATFKRRED